MRLVLDGISAYEYWMGPSVYGAYRPLRVPEARLTSFEDTTCREVSQIIRRVDARPGNLQLLVRTAAERRSGEGIECRCLGASTHLPQGSIYEIGDGLYVISPALCMVRLATQLSRIELLRAMTDLLGIFAFSPYDRQDLLSRIEPIVTIEQVSQFLGQSQGLRGTKSVRTALNWVVERSASPRETSMDLCLALPSKLGGQGMPRFEANYSPGITDAARPLTQKGKLIVDVAWPGQKRALEYNSSKYHDDEQQKEFDFEKITTLQREGYIVTPISTRQFSDYAVFSSICDGLREEFGLRDRHVEAVALRRMQTHAELLAIERRQRLDHSLVETARWRFLATRLHMDTNF